MPAAGNSVIDILLLDQIPSKMKQIEDMLLEIRNCRITVLDGLREAIQQISLHPPDLIIHGWQFADLTAESLIRALKTRSDWSNIRLTLLTSSLDEEVVDLTMQLGEDEILIRPVSRDRLTQLLDKYFPVIKTSKTDQIEAQMRKLKVEREDIRPQVKRIQNLAPLPALAHNILTIGNDPKSSAGDLRIEIEKDQSLTARILKTVNSAYYGFHRKIGNVDRAIVILGFDEIINLTLAACIIEDYHDSKSDFSRHEFWTHALGVASIARGLSRQIPGCNTKDAFVIGLLHDFGKVVLDQRFQDLWSSIVSIAKSTDMSLYEVEREVANIDHAEIGGLVAESWKLPTSLVNAIKYHHEPEMCHGLHLKDVALAHLANYFSHLHNIGFSGNPKLDEPNKEALSAIGLEDANLNEIWDSLDLGIESLKSLL